MPNENGPNKLPIPPNKIKSPPPMPSFLLINLKIKFTDHKDIYPAKRPYKENCNGDKLNISELSATKILKKVLPKSPHGIKKMFIE